jgi:hypothetical protein
MSNVELSYVLQCASHWAADPLPGMLSTMSKDQREAFNDERMTVLMEGGNQSGKSRTAVLKVVGYALELVEDCHPDRDVIIWYTTTTYDKFAEQAWRHFKAALLWPTESTAKLPTTRIESINWIKKSPESPCYFTIRRPSGKLAHVYIHTYAQGRGEFQGQTIDMAVVDEECSEEIFTEIWARTLASVGAKLVVACTPIEGEEWLDKLRKAADEGENAKHYRFNTLDNPTVSAVSVAEMKRMYADMPEQLELRLMGMPLLGSTLVYGDRIFTSDHLISYNDIDIHDGKWTLNRCIDAGYRHPACIWIAVRNDNKQVVVYRSWRGDNLTIAQAAEQILELSEGEIYHHDFIDPAVRQRSPETGQPEHNIWLANKINAAPAPDNKVRSGIERVWQLMSERIEIAGKKGGVIHVPRFRVVRETNGPWLEERRKYRFKDIVKDSERDAIDFRPVKQNDHVMDPMRYLVAAGLEAAHARKAPPPPKGSNARQWYDMRHNKKNVTKHRK